MRVVSSLSCGDGHRLGIRKGASVREERMHMLKGRKDNPGTWGRMVFSIFTEGLILWFEGHILSFV